MQRKQTTPNGGYPQEVGVEPRGNEGALSVLSAPTGGKDDEKAYSSRLLEAIVERNNLNLAYKQVKRNKGSHGVDGMNVDELLPETK